MTETFPIFNLSFLIQSSYSWVCEVVLRNKNKGNQKMFISFVLFWSLIVSDRLGQQRDKNLHAQSIELTSYSSFVLYCITSVSIIYLSFSHRCLCPSWIFPFYLNFYVPKYTLEHSITAFTIFRFNKTRPRVLSLNVLDYLIHNYSYC